MTTLNRRSWLHSAAGSIAALSAASYSKAAGADERLRVGVIGVGGMGRGSREQLEDVAECGIGHHL